MTDRREGEACARHYATGRPMRVRWANGIITEVAEISAPAPPQTWLAPALVDLQVNGYAGIDFQQDGLTTDDLLLAVQRLRADGCSRFLVTLITDEWQKLTSRLRHLASLRAASPALKQAIAGWHIEGPFLSSEAGYCGTHAAEWMIDPTPERVRELRALAGGDPLLLTMAPERRGALESIAAAVGMGAEVSLGHTNAPASIIREAWRAGASMFTHLGNGCVSELNRHDNILWRVLDSPGIYASVIPDQVHVSPALFRILHRSLPNDSIFYITDAMAAAGAAPGDYRLGGLKLHVGSDGIVRRPGTQYLSGSALRPFDGVFRAAQMLGCPWQQAWRRFSEVPARAMNWPSGIEVGQRADLCLLQVPENGEPRLLNEAADL